MATEITPDTPAMMPPDGMKSNFVDPPDYYKWTLGVGITSMAIMTMAVFVRTYTKAIILKDVRHEDYIAILALIGFLSWSVIYIYLASAGITRDLWNIRAVDMPRFLYLLNAFQVLYGPAMLCAKYFILIQLKRIFCPPGIRGPVWWTIYALVAATVMYYISCFFTFLFQCVPREKIWNPTIDGFCVNNNGAVLSAGLINLLLDLSILITPIWAIWHLRMPLKRKLGVISIFAVGFLTCGLAAAGIAYRIPLMTDPDETNASAKVGLWSFAELTGTILIGCMPIMPRFYDVTIQPSLSRISQSSLRALTSWQRSRVSQSEFSESNRSVPSNFKSINKVTSGTPSASSEPSHDYIELRDSSTKNATYRDTFEAV